MSLTPEMIDAMLLANLTREQMADLIKATLRAERAAEDARRASTREATAERVRRHRETKRNASNALQPLPDVTGVTDVTSPQRSPRPPKTIPPESTPSDPKGSSAPRGAGRSDKGAFLAEDWQPSDDDWSFAVTELGSDEAARRELQKFRNFWFAKSGADGRKRDWSATWRNWAMRAADDGTGNRKNHERHPSGAQPQRSVVDSVAAGVAKTFARRGIPLGGRQDHPGRERHEDRRGADAAGVEDAEWVDAEGGDPTRYRA